MKKFGKIWKGLFLLVAAVCMLFAFAACDLSIFPVTGGSGDIGGGNQGGDDNTGDGNQGGDDNTGGGNQGGDDNTGGGNQGGDDNTGGGNQGGPVELVPGNLIYTLTCEIEEGMALTISQNTLNIIKTAPESETGKNAILNAMDGDAIDTILLYDNACAETNGVYLSYTIDSSDNSLRLVRADGNKAAIVTVNLNAGTFTLYDPYGGLPYHWDYEGVQHDMFATRDGYMSFTRAIHKYSLIVGGVSGSYEIKDDVLTIYFYNCEYKFSMEAGSGTTIRLTLIEG